MISRGPSAAAQRHLGTYGMRMAHTCGCTPPPARLVGSGGKGQRGKQHLNEPQVKKARGMVGERNPQTPQAMVTLESGAPSTASMGRVLLEG